MSRVFGIHAVASLVESAPERLRSLYLQRGRRDDRLDAIIAAAKAAGVPVEVRERRWFDGRVDGAHQGVIADCQDIQLASEAELKLRWRQMPANPLLLILDGVTDPRNLGACLRSAEAAGVDAVLVPKRRSAPINDVAAKTAAGAVERLFIVEVTNLARCMGWLAEQGVWLYGATAPQFESDKAIEPAPVPWHEVDFTGAVGIVVGAEGDGLRSLTAARCDGLVTIPMLGSVASLNVSVATGILLFEVVRQRPLT